MFASSGYFKTIPCPYFLSGLCERPYCHFKHAIPEEKKEKSPHVPYARAAPASSVLTAGLSGSASSSSLSTTAPSNPAASISANSGDKKSSLDAISSTIDAVKSSAAGSTGLPQLLDLFSQFTQAITEVKNAVTRQADPQVGDGSEESAAADADTDAGASTSGESLSPLAQEESATVTPPASVATSMTGDVPFGIPKSSYALHRPAMAKPKCKVKLPPSYPAYNPTPKSILKQQQKQPKSRSDTPSYTTKKDVGISDVTVISTDTDKALSTPDADPRSSLAADAVLSEEGDQDVVENESPPEEDPEEDGEKREGKEEEEQNPSSQEENAEAVEETVRQIPDETPDEVFDENSAVSEQPSKESSNLLVDQDSTSPNKYNAYLTSASSRPSSSLEYDPVCNYETVEAANKRRSHEDQDVGGVDAPTEMVAKDKAEDASKVKKKKKFNLNRSGPVDSSTAQERKERKGSVQKQDLALESVEMGKKESKGSENESRDEAVVGENTDLLREGPEKENQRSQSRKSSKSENDDKQRFKSESSDRSGGKRKEVVRKEKKGDSEVVEISSDSPSDADMKADDDQVGEMEGENEEVEVDEKKKSFKDGTEKEKSEAKDKEEEKKKSHSSHSKGQRSSSHKRVRDKSEKSSSVDNNLKSSSFSKSKSKSGEKTRDRDRSDVDKKKSSSKEKESTSKKDSRDRSKDSHRSSKSSKRGDRKKSSQSSKEKRGKEYEKKKEKEKRKKGETSSSDSSSDSSSSSSSDSNSDTKGSKKGKKNMKAVKGKKTYDSSDSSEVEDQRKGRKRKLGEKSEDSCSKPKIKKSEEKDGNVETIEKQLVKKINDQLFGDSGSESDDQVQVEKIKMGKEKDERKRDEKEKKERKRKEERKKEDKRKEEKRKADERRKKSKKTKKHEERSDEEEESVLKKSSKKEKKAKSDDDSECEKSKRRKKDEDEKKKESRDAKRKKKESKSKELFGSSDEEGKEDEVEEEELLPEEDVEAEIEEDDHEEEVDMSLVADVVFDDDMDGDDEAARGNKVFDECYKIFNEAQVDSVSSSVQQGQESPSSSTHDEADTVSSSAMEPDLSSAGKKRVAHGDLARPRTKSNPYASKPSPAQVMHNRFLAMQKQQQMSKGDSKSPRQATSAFQESVLKKAQSSPVQQQQSVDSDDDRVGDIYSKLMGTRKPNASSTATSSSADAPSTPGASSSTTSPSQSSNVSSTTCAASSKVFSHCAAPSSTTDKSFIEANSRFGFSNFRVTTPSGKRIAHAPKGSKAKQRPTVPNEFGGGRVPIVVRQRYLNILIDETLKIHVDNEDEAFARGLELEKGIYETTSVKTKAGARGVYVNHAVIAVKKLREEVAKIVAQRDQEEEMRREEERRLEAKEREGKEKELADAALARRLAAEEEEKAKAAGTWKPKHADPSTLSKAAPYFSTGSFSHAAMLGGKGAANATFSQKPKKPKLNIEEELKGASMYQHLQKYLLAEEDLAVHGFPRPPPEGSKPGRAAILSEAEAKRTALRESLPHNQDKNCCRCGKAFRIYEDGRYEKKEDCCYHWGKPFNRRVNRGTWEKKYLCCDADEGSEGCQISTTHVHEGFDNPRRLHGFVRTMVKDAPPDGNFGIFALDCEMVYTARGAELARVTVINEEARVVYEAFVKPPFPVVDYNTRFSGLTAEMLRNVTRTRREVQAVLLNKFSADTILIGHSLESDLLQLKLIHNTVVDTSVVFPHKLGLPYKRALRTLMLDHLQKIIQQDDSGHDSAEDARSCLELMQWKIKAELK